MSVGPETVSSIDRVLARVARLLRFWSLADGWTIALGLTAVVFWISLAFDYLADVWLDLDRNTRVRISQIWILLLAGIFVHWVLRRLGSRPKATSLALLVERKRPELADRLLTGVELASHEHAFSQSLVRHSLAEAESQLRDFQVSSLFRRAPVIRRGVGVVILAGTIVAMAFWAPAIAQTWARRVLLLEDATYPRRSRLIVLDMDGPIRKVARGRSFEILVESDEASAPPQRVSVRLRMLDSGTRSRAYMTKIGDRRYRYLLRSVLEPIEFQVTGGDARTPRFRLETVEPPVIEQATVQISPPAYTARPSSRVNVSGSPISVPFASRVRIELQANKDLTAMSASSGEADHPIERTGPAGFALNFELLANESIRVQLEDIDGVALESPFAIDLVAVPDEAPKITATRSGVSNAITPVASVPLDIHITDDYGIESASIEYVVDTAAKGQQPVVLPNAHATNVENQVRFEVESLNLRPGQRLSLAVVATDSDALKGPKSERSEAIPFEIVTPEELLARLATRELELRQRFEQVTSELRDARAGLDTIRRGLDDPSEEAATSRRLNADRAVGVARKDAVETAVIATAFQGILDELTLNRIGNTTLLDRLDSGVRRPMSVLVDVGFPTLIAELSRLVQASGRNDLEVALSASESSLDDLLARCESILKAMAKLESFNEVVAMLRSIMEEQQGVIEETKKVRKDQIRKFLDLEE